jgi:hypothetical protein
MKYLLYFILLIVLIAYGFFYAKEHRLIKLPSPTFVACGCGGCCQGSTPVQQCLYRFNGESLEDVIAEEEAMKADEYCSNECSEGIEYKYCD